MTTTEAIKSVLEEMELVWATIGESEPALICFGGKAYRILQVDREVAEKLIAMQLVCPVK